MKKASPFYISFCMSCALLLAPPLHADTLYSSCFFYKKNHLLIIDGPGTGFFSSFNCVLGALHFYNEKEIGGLSIDFHTKGPYYDSARGPNWWSYYFEPINLQQRAAEDLCPVHASDHAFFCHEAQLRLPLKHAHALIKKYIHIKPHILQRVEDFYQDHFKGCYIIGIHYRGTDKVSEVPLVPYQVALSAIRNALLQAPQNKQAYIFLATDDLNFFSLMTHIFGHQLLSIDTMRSADTIGTHLKQEGSPYQKGEDALVDCLLLSQCDVFLQTASNLGSCVRQFNPAIPVIHLSKTPGDMHA